MVKPATGPLPGRFLVVLVAMLLGCSPPEPGPDALDDYLQRLERTLDTTTSEQAAVLAPPRLSDTAVPNLDVPSSKLDILDFLALSDCALQVNLGRRNSSLGRTASPSQVLLLDLEFLALAPACITVLTQQGKTELVHQLLSAQAIKAQYLSQRIFNAVLAGPEYARFWKPPPSLENYPGAAGGRVVDALHWFDRAIQMWLAGHHEFQVGQLEKQLYHLRSGDGGALLLAAVVQARGLEQANALVTERLGRGPLCPQASATSTVTTLKTVVTKYFAGKVQAWLATLDQRERLIMPAVLGIETQLAAALPRGYSEWAAERDATLATLRLMPKRHIDALQALSASCPGGLLGGGPQT